MLYFLFTFGHYLIKNFSIMKNKLARVRPLIALLIKWSGIAVTDGRNKIGGTVFATGRGGAFARNKVTPVNRRSSGQSSVRGVFGGLSQMFRTLTSLQITAWNALANTVTYNNIFGDAKKLSGKALFNRLNMNLVKVGETIISDAPSIDDSAPAIISFAPASDVSSTNVFLKVTFFDGLRVVPADSSLFIRATQKLSNGVSAPSSSDFRLLGYFAAAVDTDSSNMWATLSAFLGSAPAVGDNIFLEVSTVNILSGFSSPVAIAKLEIQA